MKKIVVCGSRDWDDAATIKRVLKEITHPREIIHGNARGADRMAGAIAKKLGFKVTPVNADWERYGKSAGFKRNRVMLEMKPQIVIAFWDGKSPGTKHTIAQAALLGIPVAIVPPFAEC